MIEIQTIGAPSWPKRVRAFFAELLGSRYVQHLERELLQAKLERDRVIAELRAENRELLNRLLAANKITPVMPHSAAETKSTRSIGPSRWEQMQAQAIAENAKAEAEELKNLQEN
jgi:hypothetical protein